MPNGIWYEPTSFWSTAYPVVADGLNTRFNREHFRNGSRHPKTLTRVALSAVNYPFEIMNVVPQGSGDPNIAGSAVLNQAKIRIAAPFRKNYSREQINLSAYAPRATGYQTGDTLSDSSLMGVNYLQFDKSLLMPRKASLEFGLGGVSLKQVVGLATIPLDLGPVQANAHIFTHERGGMFSGSSRQKSFAIQGSISTGFSTPDPYTGIPFPVPPGYATVPVPEVGDPAIVYKQWPAETAISSRDYEQQESSRSGSSDVCGLGVAIDQIDYDEGVKYDMLTFMGVSPGPLYKVASLASCISTRVRAKHSPTGGDYWWRPGAPLNLVCDTITDALVYDLPQPITLSFGETLSVSIELPGDKAPSYQIGISFNGFTAIEG